MQLVGRLTCTISLLTQMIFHKYGYCFSGLGGTPLGLFSAHVRPYFESGIITIPCKDKRPILGREWQRFCNEKPTEEMIDKWEETYKDVNQLGLVLGPSTQLSAFDFDYEYNEAKCQMSEKDFEKDRKAIERQILAILPPTQCIKVGKKGWTRIYRSHGALENVSANRNNVRLFDFLARNKQTIIPPSIYSDDVEFKYRWLGDPLEDCISEIPFITQNHIDEIKFLLGERVEDNSRHMKLFKWIIRQSILENDPTKIIQRAVEQDKILNNPPYLSDKKHNPSGNAEENAKGWITRILKWRDSKPKGGRDPEQLQIIKNSREMYFQFFEQTLARHKVDLISDRLMVDIVTKTEYGTEQRRWRPAANLIPELRSDALNVGIKREHVEDHLAAYKKSLTPGLLLDIPEWDGRDRIAEICKLVPAVNLCKDEKGQTLYVEIMKDICAGIFRRAFNSLEQNLFTIIRGPQGIGKNYFIEKLFSKPFDHYSAEVNVGMDMAKNYDAVEGRLVCVIGEFDQTQKVQVSFIKELITNASFTARRAYERTSDRYDLHQTFFSASNFNNVLKDTSGNRRYVIWDMPKIDWRYSECCDPDQLRAQYFHLFKSNFRMSAEAKAWIGSFNREETPDDPMELAVELYVSRNRAHGQNCGAGYKDWFSNEEILPVISEVCKACGIPEIRFRQEITRRGLTKMSNGRKFANLARLTHLAPETHPIGGDKQETLPF
jgi:hypothetical protein